MKKVYYICHCGSGHTVFGDLLELVSDDGKNLKFHITTFDWDYNKVRTITLKATREQRVNFYGEKYMMIEFRSTKEQFKFSFIKEKEIEDDAIPEKSFIEG